MKTKNKKPKEIVRQSIIILCLIVFAISAFNIICIWLQYKNAADDFTELQKETIIEPDNNKKDPEKGPVLPDYRSLLERNSDLIGWIYLPNENTYPVMYAPDRPQFYLHRNFDKEYSVAGCIFMSDENKPTDNHVLLYGHHMRDGSMFNIVDTYVGNEEYFNEHREIRFDSLDNVRIYKAFATFQTSIYGEEDGFNMYENIKNLNEEEYNTFVSEVKKYSTVSVDDIPEYGTPLLTLSTCSYQLSDGTGRAVLVCYLDKEYDKDGNPVEIEKITEPEIEDIQEQNQEATENN